MWDILTIYVLYSARTTPMPSLYELTTLFDELPYLPPPTPRRRMPVAATGKALELKAETPSPQKPTAPLQRAFASFQLLFPFLRPQASQTGRINSLNSPGPRRVNPFAVLKAGKKMVIVAAVDAGTISFFRFGQGAFEDFPMN